MIPRPPRSTRTDTLFPYTTLVRSTRVTPAEAGGTGAGRTLTLDRARPVRVPKTKPPDRGTPRPPPSAACTALRSEEHTSELQSLMRISYAVFCLKQKKSTSKIATDKEHASKMPKTSTPDTEE